MTPRESVSEEAHRLVRTDRNLAYDHPVRNLQRTADLWAPILGVPVTAEQVALCMIQLKVARQIFRPKRDNLVDVCGWAETIEMLGEADG